MDNDFVFDFDFSPDTEEQEPPKQKEKKIRTVHKYGHRQLSRKAASEQALFDSLDWYFQPGDCYHCFSFGDVDSMTYFKHVLHQQRVHYLALSTWCMAGEDVDDLLLWYQRGYIKRVDFFLGEIFPGSYPAVYSSVKNACDIWDGRCVIFRNHAKVMAIVGEKFDCLIESSANVNTNPRSENTVLTVDSGLVAEYVKMFNEIIPFNKDYKDKPGYIIPDDRTWK